MQQIPSGMQVAGKNLKCSTENVISNLLPNITPIILQVSNSSSSPVKNFEIFFNKNYFRDNKRLRKWSSDGNFTIDDATISSIDKNITFEQLLLKIKGTTIDVGAVYLEMISGNKQQIKDVYQVSSQNFNKESYTKQIRPNEDAYNKNSGISYNTLNFQIGTSTKLAWRVIYAETVFQVTIFPSHLVDPSIALNGSIIMLLYNKPALIAYIRR